MKSWNSLQTICFYGLLCPLIRIPQIEQMYDSMVLFQFNLHNESKTCIHINFLLVIFWRQWLAFSLIDTVRVWHTTNSSSWIMLSFITRDACLRLCLFACILLIHRACSCAFLSMINGWLSGSSTKWWITDIYSLCLVLCLHVNLYLIPNLNCPYMAYYQDYCSQLFPHPDPNLTQCEDLHPGHLWVYTDRIYSYVANLFCGSNLVVQLKWNLFLCLRSYALSSNFLPHVSHFSLKSAVYHMGEVTAYFLECSLADWTFNVIRFLVNIQLGHCLLSRCSH